MPTSTISSGHILVCVLTLWTIVVDLQLVNNHPQSNNQKRIIGGRVERKRGNFVVFVNNGYYIDNRTICQGALFKNSFVITLQSCLLKFPMSDRTRVIIGIDSSDRTQTASVSRIFRHPKYDPKTLSGNIALLRLGCTRIFPRIPRMPEDARELPDRNVVLPGEEIISPGTSVHVFGRNIFGVSSLGKLRSMAVVHSAEKTLLSREECAAKYKKAGRKFRKKDETRFCAETVDKNVCIEGKGSPLILSQSLNSDSQHPVLLGLASSGVNRCTDPTYLKQYVNVTRFRRWINKKTARYVDCEVSGLFDYPGDYKI
ncbi:chymotrypsin A-like [Convolutriloba macropyga]|uniref:chymotrypsin A-like n=1 Tax=Convolutriloba macropyga TaxID=536237 RepID=UPI003F51EEC9